LYLLVEGRAPVGEPPIRPIITLGPLHQLFLLIESAPSKIASSKTLLITSKTDIKLLTLYFELNLNFCESCVFRCGYLSRLLTNSRNLAVFSMKRHAARGHCCGGVESAADAPVPFGPARARSQQSVGNVEAPPSRKRKLFRDVTLSSANPHPYDVLTRVTAMQRNAANLKIR